MTEQQRIEELEKLKSRNIFLNGEIERNLRMYPELAGYLYGHEPVSGSLKIIGDQLKDYLRESSDNQETIVYLESLAPNRPTVKRDYKYELKQIKKYWWLYLLVIVVFVVIEWLKEH